MGLIVALDESDTAAGTLFWDDGLSVGMEQIALGSYWPISSIMF